jgi:hypothetical protein
LPECNPGAAAEVDGIFQLQKVFYLSFIHFLKGKASKEKMGTAILSESVLAKDWISPEEDEAWKNL